MRLSEAIRLGAMLHPQSFLQWRERDASFQIVGTCALGAAAEAGYFDTHLMPAWGGPVCPECQRSMVPAIGCGAVIAHLNDTHRWTREQIADWVATVELADERSEASRTADAVARTADLVTG